MTTGDGRRAVCPMDGLLRTITGPWTTYLLWVLGTEGPLRFGVLKRRAVGISPKVLTERLRHLEAAGLVARTYVPTVPPQVSYALTDRGRELQAALDALATIAVRWEREEAAGARGEAA